ncbi:hypothetical protein Z945_2225 [Sulfitobacter noctilucae]|uniref:hypothetical protein n=1 Tax=Sulfitobacter noctilucae TaxID=1342302 RepID=UPI000469703D|nr:hypothetical protein [Sulfitobacter noctilucae]KIN61235.1 hypothetical protein Z945_2225 [Sulfitobacter noctilucae]
MHFRLTKNDSADIGFALHCLKSSAIHFGEFKEWIYHVITDADDPPHYLFDMLEVAQLIDFKPMRIMGWHSSFTLSDDEAAALSGIALLRGISTMQDSISKKEALERLQDNGAFFDRVKAFFPFLDLEQAVGPDPDRGK